MIEITHTFERYRECIRHLWNDYYLSIHRNRKESDPWSQFWQVENMIFFDLILTPLGYTWADYFTTGGDIHKPAPFLPFRLVPQGMYGIPAMISREPGLSGSWDHEIARIPHQGIDLRFVALFDWDEQGFRSYQYFQVKILECAHESSINGHYALIDAQYAKIMYEDVRPAR